MRDYQEKDLPTVKSLDGLIRLLQREGVRHRSLYHYTRWDAFANNGKGGVVCPISKILTHIR